MDPEPEVPVDNPAEKREKEQYIPGCKQWTTLFIRNVPWRAQPGEIRGLFAAYGEVKAVRIPTHEYGGSIVNRGFGFVDMEKKEDALAAIEALSGKAFKDRTLIITESTSTYGENVPNPDDPVPPKKAPHPKTDRPPPRQPERDRRDRGPRYPDPYDRYDRRDRDFYDPYQRDRMYMPPPPPDYYSRPPPVDRYGYDLPPWDYYMHPYPEPYDRRDFPRERYDHPHAERLPPRDRPRQRDRCDERRK